MLTRKGAQPYLLEVLFARITVAHILVCLNHLIQPLEHVTIFTIHEVNHGLSVLKEGAALVLLIDGDVGSSRPLLIVHSSRLNLSHATTAESTQTDFIGRLLMVETVRLMSRIVRVMVL